MTFTKDDTKVVKAIAVMLMLYHHLFGFPERIYNNYINLIPTINNHNISFLIASFGKICVTIFIFLAGYSSYISMKNNKEESVVKKRVYNLYKIFWKVFLVIVPIGIIFGRIRFNILDILLNFFGLKTSIVTEWWFFTPYIILIIFSPLIIKLMNKLNFVSNLILTILANVICLEIIPLIQLNSWTSLLSGNFIFYNIHLTTSLLSSFMMGILFAKYDILSYFKNKYCNNYMYVIISFGILGIIFYLRGRLGYLYDYIYTPIFIVCITIIFNTKNRLIEKIRKILIKIGNESTIIWLTHSFYCYILCQRIIFMPKIDVLIFIWLLLISYTTSLIIKYIFNILNIKYQLILKKLEIK